jgi:hypothetical protein
MSGRPSAAIERRLKEIASKMSAHVDVGFLEGATYPDGTPVASVAFWDEYGHGGPFPSPARPYFRTMIAAESPSWPGKVARLAEATGGDGARVLALMGEDIQGALIQSIANFNSVPLSPTTLRLREKFWSNPDQIRAGDVVEAQKEAAAGAKLATGTQAKPLVWRGILLNGTGYQVKK